MVLTTEKAELLERVASALQRSGWQVLWLNGDHPTKARLIKEDVFLDVWIHIWNVTPGGRPATRPLERRIQPTGIGDHFRASPGVLTLILGWSAEAQVFAAFDYRFHDGKLGSSPSIQTDLPALEAAAENGIGIFAKATGELSIAVRPDLLAVYVEQVEALHDSGADPAQLASLVQMAEDPLNIDPSDLPADRRSIMTTTLRRLRDRRFTQKVLDAYGHRCAMCEVQLRLLDAAHILPVAHPDSNDQVTNGIALCALHHRAYDAALVTFDASYTTRVNPALIAQLALDDRDGGLGNFQSVLRPSLLLPLSTTLHPSSQMVAKANLLRGWP